MAREIQFDYVNYFILRDTARLIPFDVKSLDILSLKSDSELRNNYTQIGEDITFVKSDERFNAKDIPLILEIHAPKETEGYWDESRYNKLKMKFFKKNP